MHCRAACFCYVSADAELFVGVAVNAASELHIYQQFDVGDTLGAGGKTGD